MVKIYTVKQLIKRGLQIIAAKLGPHTRRADQPQLLVLMYHRILPLDDERTQLEEPGMIVSPDTFRQNLETVSQYFQFVQLSDWLEKQQNGDRLPAKACAITFDDGWMDNYEFAYPILSKMNIPATIFLVSDMVGSKDRFWPERLARTVVAIAQQRPNQWNNPLLEWIRNSHTGYQFTETAPSREEISQIIACAKEFSDQEIHLRLDNIESALNLNMNSEIPSLLDWSQITEMMASGLIEFGSHTCHHIRLNAQTTGTIVEKEILESKRQIEVMTGQSVRGFCFPNGDYSPEALKLVQTHYAGAVTTNNGWNFSDTNPHLLRRIGIHEDIASDKIAFLARISGWL